MEPEPLNTPETKSETKASSPRARVSRKRRNVLEFEFTQQELKATTPQRPVRPKAPAPAPPPVQKIAAQEPVLTVSPVEAQAPYPPSLPTQVSERHADSPPAPPIVPSTLSPTRPIAHHSEPKASMANSSLKPSTITDFKRNVDQQKKEQKSFSNVLATLTYILVISVILVAGLAGLGAYEFYLELKGQSATILSLDHKYEAEVTGMNEDLHRTKMQLESANGQVAHLQEELSILRANLDKSLADVRADRLARARETAALQKRVGDLENRSSR